MASDPPFHQAYKSLFEVASYHNYANENENELLVIVEIRELLLIDLSRLNYDVEESEREECKREIAMASQEWGFFQVINHGISKDILEKMRQEQVKVFKEPFVKKIQEDKFLNFPAGSYRWGTKTATCLNQLSWSEAFHIPLVHIFASADGFTNPSEDERLESSIT